MTNNKQIPLSNNQIVGFKRAIQLFKKSLNKSKNPDFDSITGLKLRELQDEVSKALHFGSYNELLTRAKSLGDSPIHIDCTAIDGEVWQGVRKSLVTYFDKVYGVDVDKYVKCINWYPLPDESITSSEWLLDLLVGKDSQLIEALSAHAIPSLPHTYKESSCFKLNHWDIRYVYALVKAVASENNIPWVSIDDGHYIVGTCAITVDNSTGDLLFCITQLGHHNNKTILPLVACAFMDRNTYVVFREFDHYMETWKELDAINEFICVSESQTNRLLVNSLFSGANSDLLVSA